MDISSLGKLFLSTDMMSAKAISSFVESYTDNSFSLTSIHPVQNCIVTGKLLDDFTSFQVYATSSAISGKASLENELELHPEKCLMQDFLQLSARSIDQETGLQYIEDIEPCTKASLEIYTIECKDNIDVMIDWGDGTTTSVKDEPIVPLSSIQTYSKDGHRYYDLNHVNGIVWYDSPNFSGIEHLVQLVHDYAIEGKYEVKVYGSDCYGIRCGLFGGGLAVEDATKYNILSECLGYTHKFSSHIRNASSFANGSKRMQKIQIPAYTLDNIANSIAMFKDCINLVIVNGNRQNTFLQGRNVAPAAMFQGCKNLKTCTNFYLPLDIMYTGDLSYSYMFYKCNSLESDIVQLLPKYGFTCRFIDISNFFNGCIHVTCSDYQRLASILWKDTSKVFSNYHSTFIGCSSLDMSQIPTAWGGTNSDIQIDNETGTVKDDLALEEISQALDVILT